MADLMRYIGGDVYHRDWGWWDRAGDWNGPDFRATGDYLRKSGMGQLIYAFLYTVDPPVEGRQGASRLGHRRDARYVEAGSRRAHEAATRQLPRSLGRLRVAQRQHADLLRATATTRRCWARTPGCAQVIRDFLDKYPGCAFQAVNGGGNDAGYDYARYASTVSFSDGAVGIIRNYYASLLLPPDKTSDIPDIWNPDNYDKATWRGLLCINFDMTGDTWDPAKLEGLRELIDIYHYLHKQGVVGRWVRVYRPDRSPATTRRCTSSGSAATGGGASSFPSGPRPAPSPSSPRDCCRRKPTRSRSTNRMPCQQRTGHAT